MIGRLLESEELEDRDWPTVALTAHARELGASVVRVHNVKPNVHAMRMTEAILA
jgi:dihydropteroate synthase